ncbi:hypothetical protein G6O67_007969 [Ophiocordyceps sinensis]|uniref:Terpenoid synthase n=1 Tax=Ophiocordyceps sinensis TaxID=72228 RepID=A0A8H4LRX9_9HYPO|nr:hypothetical protein G6O67_007969 [Ophiocordyceps sinensis]
MADHGSMQCHIDMLGKEGIGSLSANMNPHSGGFASLVWPYTLPKRLALIAYIVEGLFIIDDVGMSEVEQQSRVYGNGCAKDSTRKSGKRREQVVSKMKRSVLEMDKKLGRKVIRELNDWKQAEEAMSFEAKMHTSLDEYLADRMHDIGWGAVVALARFGAALELTDDQEAAVAPVSQPLYELTILHNDYFSFDKEYVDKEYVEKEYVEKGYVDKEYVEKEYVEKEYVEKEYVEKEYVEKCQDSHGAKVANNANAVALYTRCHSMSVEEAKAAVKAQCAELEDRYRASKHLFLQQQGADVSSSVVAWLDMLEAMVAGNLLWSISAPRYDLSAENPYPEYYRLRRDEGVHFFADCNESDEIISTTCQDPFERRLEITTFYNTSIILSYVVGAWTTYGCFRIPGQ